MRCAKEWVKDRNLNGKAETGQAFGTGDLVTRLQHTGMVCYKLKRIECRDLFKDEGRFVFMLGGNEAVSLKVNMLVKYMFLVEHDQRAYGNPADGEDHQ